MEKNRIYLFDNIKIFLIFLVVSIHLLAAVSEVVELNYVFQIYMLVGCAFHMPLFIFISGHFSKKETCKESASNILFTYIIAQLLLVIYQCMTKGVYTVTISNLFIPGFSMWYLIVLFFLRYMLSDLIKIKNILFLSLLISIFIMGIDMSGSLEKTFVKLFANAFYFLLGYYISTEHILIFRKIKYSKCFGLGMLVIGIIFAVLYNKYGSLELNLLRIMMLRSTPISPNLNGGYIVFVIIIIYAMWMSIAIILIMPDKKMKISCLGRNTSVIYIAQAILYLEFRRQIKNNIYIGANELQFIAVFLSILCVIIFGLSFWEKGLQKIILLMRKNIVRGD